MLTVRILLATAIAGLSGLVIWFFPHITLPVLGLWAVTSVWVYYQIQNQEIPAEPGKEEGG